MSPLKLAYLNLSRHLSSTLIAIVSISLSVGVAGLLYRVNLLQESRFRTMVDGPNVVVGAKSSSIDILLGSTNAEMTEPNFIPMNLFKSLRARATVVHGDEAMTSTEYIQQISPYLVVGKVSDFWVVGTDETLFSTPTGKKLMSFQEGRWPTREGLVLGAQAAQRLGAHLNQSFEVTAKSLDHRDSLQVSGVFRSTGRAWDYLIFAPIDWAQEFLSQTRMVNESIWNKDVLHYYAAYISPFGFQDFKSLIDERTVAQAVFVDREKQRLRELTQNNLELGLLIVSLILILGALTVATLILTRFEAMKTQIAMLRAIGFTEGRILGWLTWEGLILALFSILFGAIIDASLFPVAQGYSQLSPELLMMMDISLFSSWPVWLAALLAASLSVVAPFLRMQNQDIHQTLR